MRLAFGALIAAALAASGCGEDGEVQCCNAMGTVDSITIRSETPLPTGTWRFELESDGVREACQVTVPTNAGGSAGCDDALWYIRLDPPGTAGFELVAAYDLAPERVFFTLFRDSERVYQEEIEPEYALKEPNGEGCGFQRTAVHDIELDLD